MIKIPDPQPPQNEPIIWEPAEKVLAILENEDVPEWLCDEIVLKLEQWASNNYEDSL